MVWISPNFKDDDFPSGMSIEQKIKVFADRVNGWQLNIAQQCADNITHSGFAVLHIVVSYFEMIAKYRDGFTQDRESEQYFTKGVFSVFPELENQGQISDRLLDKLYSEVRCGLYHGGITGSNIWITSDFDSSIVFATDEKVAINPHRLVLALKQHFKSYIQELQDSRNKSLRDNFEARFSYQLK